MRELSKELRGRYTPSIFLTWVLLALATLGFSAYRSRGYQLRDELDYFSFLLSGILPLVLPVIAVLVGNISFSKEVAHRYILYTRTRRSISKTLSMKLVAIVILTCSFFFLLTLICFIFAYYIEPHLGWATYDPAGYGLTPELLLQDTYTRYTFTQILQYGVLTYGIFYSLWVGLNASLYAVMGFVLLLFIKNRFLALSLPYIVYLCMNFIFSALGLESYRPSYLIYPFDRIQEPMFTIVLPVIVLVGVLVLIWSYVRKNLDKIGNLT